MEVKVWLWIYINVFWRILAFIFVRFLCGFWKFLEKLRFLAFGVIMNSSHRQNDIAKHHIYLSLFVFFFLAYKLIKYLQYYINGQLNIKKQLWHKYYQPNQNNTRSESRYKANKLCSVGLQGEYKSFESRVRSAFWIMEKEKIEGLDLKKKIE